MFMPEVMVRFCDHPLLVLRIITVIIPTLFPILAEMVLIIAGIDVIPVRVKELIILPRKVTVAQSVSLKSIAVVIFEEFLVVCYFRYKATTYLGQQLSPHHSNIIKSASKALISCLLKGPDI